MFTSVPTARRKQPLSGLADFELGRNSVGSQSGEVCIPLTSPNGNQSLDFEH
jgi:hypothetical protein